MGNIENIYNGLTISAIGLLGVFSVLIVFYLCTKLLMFVALKTTKKDSNS